MIIRGDARSLPLASGIAQTCVTSPPFFGLRDYGNNAQIGLEATPASYVTSLVDAFREVRRVLKADGTAWLNLGDSYGTGGSGQNFYDPRGEREGGGRVQAVGGFGHVRNIGVRGFHKQLMGIPWRVAFALQADGWYLRSDVIWSKPNPMPESVTDRPTKSHEYLFLLAKSERYYYDAAAIFEPYAEQTLRDREADGGLYDGQGTKDYIAAGVQNPSDVKRRIAAGIQKKNEKSGDRRKAGFNDRWDAKEYDGKHGDADPQSASRRMLLSAKAARDNGAPHDQPFGNAGRNKRTVWTIPTMPYSGAHFATFPEALVLPCVLAGSREGDLVIDPFCGTGTVGVVAARCGRRFVGVDLAYHALSRERTAQQGLFVSEQQA